MTVFWGLAGLLGLLGCVGLLRSRAVPTEADPLARYPQAREPARPNADAAHTPLMTPVVTPDLLGSEQPLNQRRAPVRPRGREAPEPAPRSDVRARPQVQAEARAVPDLPRQPRHAPAAPPLPVKSVAAPARAAEPRAAESRAGEPRAAEPRAAEPRAAEPRPTEPHPVESRPEAPAAESGTIAGEIPAPRTRSVEETPTGEPAPGKTTAGRKAWRGLLNQARRVLKRH
ncbi:hypothetical protein ACWEVP_28260 [Amycolatopsis sp. NPDC003865]